MSFETHEEIIEKINSRKTLCESLDLFLTRSFEETKKTHEDSLLKITKLITQGTNISKFNFESVLLDHKESLDFCIENLKDKKVMISDMDFDDLQGEGFLIVDKSVDLNSKTPVVMNSAPVLNVNVVDVLRERMKKIDIFLDEINGHKVKEENKRFVSSLEKEKEKIVRDRKDVLDVEKEFLVMLRNFKCSLERIMGKVCSNKKKEVKAGIGSPLVRLNKEMKNLCEGNNLKMNKYFQKNVLHYYQEFVQKISFVFKKNKSTNFLKNLNCIFIYMEKTLNYKLKIDQISKDIIGRIENEKNKKKLEDFLKSSKEKIKDYLKKILTCFESSSKIEKSLKTLSSVYYDKKLNYKDYLELKSIFSKENVDKFEGLFDNMILLMGFRNDFKTMKNFVFDSYQNTEKDFKNIYEKGNEFFLKLDPIVKYFKSYKKGKDEKLKIPVFKKIVNEYLRDFEILDLGYKAISVHSVKLDELKVLIKERDKFNKEAKELFITIGDGLSFDKKDLELMEKLKNVAVKISEKLDSLKSDVKKISENLGFDIPVKIELEKMSNFIFFGILTKHLKRKSFLKRDKRIIKYFGEMKYNNKEKKFIKHGIGKTFYDNSFLEFYGKWEDDYRHGSGCAYTLSKRMETEGEWRKGKLLRKKIESIQLVEFNLEKYLKKICYTTDLIGYGGFSEVFKIEVNGEVLAAKILRRNQTEAEDFERECKILCSLNHENIISFKSISFRPLGYLTEYCSKGSVLELIKTIENKVIEKFDFSKKFNIILETTKGMNYLHLCHIIHRDLKWANVLLNSEEVVKIIDFGLSKSVASYRVSAQNTSRLGTSFYISPECFCGSEYSYPSDVYSFAIMLYEIVFDTTSPYNLRKGSFLNPDLHGAKASRDPNYRPVIFRSMITRQNKFLVDLMRMCWAHDSRERLTFDKIEEVLLKNKKDVFHG